MTDTPTREQVREALALYDLAIARQRGTTGANTKIIHAAARLWLEGPTVDEAMIQRGIEAIKGVPVMATRTAVEAVLLAALQTVERKG